MDDFDSSAAAAARTAPCGSVRVSAFAALTLAAAGLAAQGLPFSEPFDNAALRDAARTTADWGLATPGALRLQTASPLMNGFADTMPTEALPGEFATRALVLADMNGDGHLDLVEGANGQSGVYLNNGNGNFAARVAFESRQANTRGIAVADVNGDGYLDVAAGNFGQTSRLYINSGDGVTYTTQDISTELRRTDFVVLADVNGDGHVDAVTANQGQPSRIYLNTGDPLRPFGPTGVAGTDLWFARNTQALAAGDLDHDGDIDLVSLNENEVNSYHLNNGSGVFSRHDVGSEAEDSQDGILADLNGDGFLDLVVANTAEGQVSRIYFHTGNPAAPFTSSTPGVPFTAPNDPDYPHAVLAADADHDGDLDLFVATAGPLMPADEVNRLYVNDGAGNFPTHIRLGAAMDISNTGAVGDVDGDGDIDFISGNEARDANNAALGAVNRLYRNAGTSAGGAAVRQLAGVARSLRVDAEAAPIQSVRLGAVPELLGAHNRAEFWVSSDGGVNWLYVVPNGRPVFFPSGKRGQDLRWRARLNALSPAAVHGAPALALDAVTLALNTSAPVASVTIGAQSATVGTPFGPVSAQFADADGDAVWHSLTGRPVGSGIRIDPATGAVSGTPTEADAGASPLALTVVATDGARRTEQGFTLTVAGGVNAPPSFTSTAPTTATAGAAYAYAITAADPEGGALTIVAQAAPAWLTLTDNGNGTGSLSGTPAAADVGNHAVELSVTDPAGGVAKQAFTITVAVASTPPPPNPPPNPPSGGGGGGGGGSTTLVELMILLLAAARFAHRHPRVRAWA